MQTGSAFILMPSFFGAAPSSTTVPLTVPALAVSTFCPAEAPAGAVGSADLFDVSCPPPHATIVVASAAASVPSQAFRKRIEDSSSKKDSRQNSHLFYLASPA